ncbi:hypothetical protein [uncultured Paraglaciecola sp.]|jgi:hypothetical protein|uniref:hypothetical protein n=1 Tax=uncultured Paraglaciecola sp. TaxID=1765024 RepID=UPI0025FC2552|nr:hypothetical protein [uncultured Paraglaciecola sp.]
MDSEMNVLKLAIVSVVFVTGCSGDNKEVSECPEITLPVIIPIVNVKFFDANEEALNVCDAILTVDSANGNETIYGSALNNCSETFSIRGGYDLIEHDLLVEKAGYVSQRFESVIPISTKCAYETLDLSVYLDKD